MSMPASERESRIRFTIRAVRGADPVGYHSTRPDAFEQLSRLNAENYTVCRETIQNGTVEKSEIIWPPDAYAPRYST